MLAASFVQLTNKKELHCGNLPVLQLTPVGATLEDIFIKLTGQRVTEDEGRAGRGAARTTQARLRTGESRPAVPHG